MVQNDEQIAALLATDLDRHFQQVVVRYQQRLYGFAVRQVGNAQDAEDIVQEAFLRAYHALADYPAERVRVLKVLPWLFKITLHICYRSLGRTSLPLTTLDTSDESSLLELEDESQEQPEAALEASERLRELTSLVSALPEPYRAVINFYYFEDLTYREIAELLNRPIGTIKSYVSRGVQMVRKQLEAQKEH